MADLTTSSAIDTFMQAANQAAARTALGLGTAATQASGAFATAAQGTDARAPTAHASTHVNGTDDIQSATASQKGLATAAQITKLDGIEAAADVTDAGNVGSSINGASAVTTLNDTDKVPVTVAGTLSNIAYSAFKTLLNAIYALKGAATGSGLTMATNKLLGRGTAGTGALEEITLGTNLSFSGTTLNAAGGGGGGGGSSNVWIPGSYIMSKVTSGPGILSSETATYDQNYDTIDFDAGADEFADFLYLMPNNWNYGTVTARFYWTSDSGSGTVCWTLKGVAYADAADLDAAGGTAGTVTDTSNGAAKENITDATGAITIAGTPAANKAIQFTVGRDVSEDSLGVDARLRGIEILYTTA